MDVQIWNSMIRDEPFSLKSKRWSDIGFQGSCPATDFRGMGVLGAENLRCVLTFPSAALRAIHILHSYRYFIKHHRKLALSIFSSSLHPWQWQVNSLFILLSSDVNLIECSLQVPICNRWYKSLRFPVASPSRRDSQNTLLQLT